MNKIKFYFLNSIILISLIFSNCSETHSVKEDIPKIAIAGIAIESSTFSPAVSEIDAFRIRTGEDILSSYPFLQDSSEYLQRAQWYPALRGRSLPGGIVSRQAYDSMVSGILNRLKENLPYDGLFFDIHGAMSVQGLDDPEGDLIKKVREVIGYETLVSTSMDLHGNVSETLASESDLITCYRMAPHEDALESKERAVNNLITRLENGKGKPKYKAWIPVPILLPGEKTSTRIEPAKTLYSKVDPITKRDGILDAAIWIGYAWADEPRNHAVVMVTGDEQEAVKNGAEELADHFWSVRNEFDFVAPTTTFEDALSQALESDAKPFIISDMGDNPTAGGAGDVTWTINELLKREEFKNDEGPTLIYASIPGPKLIEKSLEAGVGNNVEGEAGAIVDSRYSGPAIISGTVHAIKKGDSNAEVEVVIKSGSMFIIVTKRRKPYHRKSDFTELNLDPENADIVMVKIGYLVPELYNMREDWVMALTPGGVDQNLERLDYKRIKRPMFPLDKEMENPDLNARFMPISGE